MNEMEFKNKLSEAMAEPAVPPKLVEDTVARARTIVQGRREEERLCSGKDLSAENRAGLLADGILGRLAVDGALPLGADTAELKSQLLGSDAFGKMKEMPPDRMLAGLKNGSLITQLGQGGEKPKVQEREAPVLKSKVPKLQKKTPGLGGPGMG